MEVGRLNRVIRRLQESPAADGFARSERERTITHLMRRIVEIFDAIDALGMAQAGDEGPSEGE